MSTPAKITSIVTLLCSSVIWVIAEEPAQPTQEPSPYNLFVGLDLSLPVEEVYYPVTTYKDYALQVEVDGKTISQKIGDCEELKYLKNIKVTPNFIDVTDVKCISDYSIDADPAMQAGRTSMLLAAAAADARARSNVAIRIKQELEGTVVDQYNGATINQQIQNEQNFIDQNDRTANVNPETLKQGDLEDHGHDILRVEFTAHAQQTIDNPLLLVILRLKEHPNEVAKYSWFYFTPLSEISQKNDHYHFATREFPDGMIIDSYELYFFSEGNEIASSLSDKRVAISRLEAKSYLMFQYTDSHEGVTLPAKPVWKENFGQTLKSVSSELMDTQLTLDIDIDGNVTAVHVPKTVSAQMNDTILQSIRKQFFYPALDKGNPVASQLRVSLKELFV